MKWAVNYQGSTSDALTQHFAVINMHFMVPLGYLKLFLRVPTLCANCTSLTGLGGKHSWFPNRQIHPYSHPTQRRTDRTYKQGLRWHWGAKTYTDCAFHLNLPYLGQKLEQYQSWDQDFILHLGKSFHLYQPSYSLTQTWGTDKCGCIENKIQKHILENKIIF